jgi:predicted YcjX-like family ATPase
MPFEGYDRKTIAAEHPMRFTLPPLPPLASLAEDLRLAARAVGDFGAGLVHPTVRLGVTGLSGAGKTVFITALVHNLLHQGRLPVFEALASGRIARARLEPQPDDAVPRFDYETHLRALIEERRWPESTSRVSELRLVIEYQSATGSARERTLTLDIVDYPGEWLLDLPLLSMSYAQWSAEALILSRSGPREQLAREWHAHHATLDPNAREDEQAARTAARLFTDYLKACRSERYAMRLLPPGRFLMPGDLAGSPALTFAPMEVYGDKPAPAGSLWAMMERRYEAYKSVVVRPFFRDHFARLDRQVVLVDALAAFNAGPDAVTDLEHALAQILACFRTGRSTIASALFRPRIDRILFAATKADHLHHTSHDRLERILQRLTARAVDGAKFSGAQVDAIALAAVRATREASLARGDETLPAIIGTPLAGEAVGERFDGETDVASFPGDLPDDPAALFDAFKGLTAAAADETDFRFLRFRPPPAEPGPRGGATLPHIRLDRALQFLIGDRLA